MFWPFDGRRGVRGAANPRSQPGRQTPSRPAAAAASRAAAIVAGHSSHEQPDARETQERLNEIFNQYPPSVREVLRIDPTLIYRPDYLANYPVLAAFLEQHPEIAHNPGYFFGEWRAPGRTTVNRIDVAFREVR